MAKNTYLIACPVIFCFSVLTEQNETHSCNSAFSLLSFPSVGGRRSGGGGCKQLEYINPQKSKIQYSSPCLSPHVEEERHFFIKGACFKSWSFSWLRAKTTIEENTGKGQFCFGFSVLEMSGFILQSVVPINLAITLF